MFLGECLLSRQGNALDVAHSPLDNRSISFETSDTHYRSVYSHALDTLQTNITTVQGYSRPVLIEGSNYGGIWLECAPHEGLFYSLLRPDVARNNHLAFFAVSARTDRFPAGFARVLLGLRRYRWSYPSRTRHGNLPNKLTITSY
jgi:hypothetical protein